MNPHLSVMIAESVGPKDSYVRRTDGFAANEVLQIQQVRTQYRIVLDLPRLIRAIAQARIGNFQVFHLSCHGNDDGILLSDGTAVNWLKLGKLMRKYANLNRSLVLSCCSGGYVGVTKALQKEDVFFGYVFGSTAKEGVGFTDSCLAWSVLYSQIYEHGFSRVELRKTLDKINVVVPGKFLYRRGNGSQYLRYPVFAER